MFPTDSHLKSIGDRAFYSFEFYNVDPTLVLPEGLETIGAEAFQKIDRIKQIVIPETVSFIGDNICNPKIITLAVKEGSYAESWAIEHGYTVTHPVTVSDDSSWLNN